VPNKNTLDLLVQPSEYPGSINVNPEFLAALKEERAQGKDTPIADAFKKLVDAAYTAAKAGKL